VSAAPPRPHTDAAPGQILCPRCESVCEPFQEYCVECGFRLPPHPTRASSLASRWQRARLLPGARMWPALLLLPLAAAGGAVAYFATKDQQPQTTIVATTSRARHPIPATTRTAGVAPTSTAGFVPAPAATTPSGASTNATAPPAQAAALVTWPAGTTGYTTILQSIPASAGKRRATALAQRAIAAGLKRVGYLDSGQFSSLHPGYYVVFSGIYNSFGDAQANAGTATSSGFVYAYVRRIVP